MSKKAGFYAVHVGEKPGVYRTWKECSDQVTGYNGAKFKKFSTKADADAFVKYGDVIRPKEVVDENTVIIYTDGSCINGNGSINAKAGVGIWFGDDHKYNVSIPLPHDSMPVGVNPTNQIAELYAIFLTFKICLDNVEFKNKKLVVRTDSDYSMKCLYTWYDGWVRNGWKTADKKPVKHQKLIKDTYAMMLELNATIVHVKAHNGEYGNECADKMAKDGALMYKCK